MVGANYQKEAHKCLASLLIWQVDSVSETNLHPNETSAASTVNKHMDGDHDHLVIMGSDATSLMHTLVQRYCTNNGALSQGDKIIIATKNLLANVLPWLAAANAVGAKAQRGEGGVVPEGGGDGRDREGAVAAGGHGCH